MVALGFSLPQPVASRDESPTVEPALERRRDPALRSPADLSVDGEFDGWENDVDTSVLHPHCRDGEHLWCNGGRYVNKDGSNRVGMFGYTRARMEGVG